MDSHEWRVPRRTPGFSSFVGAVWIVSFLNVWMGRLAPAVPGERFPDPLDLLILSPLWNLAFILFGVLLVNRSLGRRLDQALSLAWRALPILFLPEIFNLLFSWFGRVSDPLPFTSLGRLPVEFLTLGIYPQALASWGTLLTLALCALGSFFVIHRVLQRRGLAIRTGALFLLGSLFLLAIPSMVGWFGLEPGNSLFTASSYSVQRGLIFLSHEGYWWRNLSDRYLGLGIGEAQASVRLLLGGITFLAFVLLGVLIERRKTGLTIHQEFAFLRPWRLFFFSSILLWGMILASLDGSFLPWRFTTLLALFLLIVSWLSSWLWVMYRNDVFDLPEDEERQTDHPLVSGAVDPRLWQDRLRLILPCLLIGGFLLGWPVLLCLVAYVLFQELRSHPWFRFKTNFLFSLFTLASSSMATLLTGWFFVRQDASMAGLSARFFIAFFLFFGFFFLPSLTHASCGGMVTHWIEARLLKGRASMAVFEAGVTFLAYALLPALSGWWKWWIIALPIGAISAFSFLSPHPKPTRPALWLAFFFLISGLFLVLPGMRS